MIQHIFPIQTKVFDYYEDECEEKMNEFIKNVDLIDIKMNTVVAVTGQFFTRYLVIYSNRC